LDRYQPSFVDAVSTNIPYLFFLIDRGMKQTKSGGARLLYPIHGANNDTFQSYASYDTLNTTPQDNQVVSIWNWKNLAVSITIDGPLLRQNSGSDTQIINVLTTKIEEAEIAMREGISDQLFGSAGDSSNDLNGLQNILSTATTTGTTGSLSRATNSFWRHNSRNVSNDFSANGVNRMRSLYNDCLTGTEKVNLIVATQSVMENYELGITSTAGQSERFVVSSPFNSIKGDQGFHVLRYKGAMMFFDDNTVANSTYFINTNTVIWVVHTDADFATRPFISVAQQDAKISQILVQANQVCTNLQRNGVLLNGDTI
jgi:hypothetical protein